MPELPDLEVFSKNLNKKLKGKKLLNVEALVTRKMNVSKQALSKAINGTSIKEIRRSGKQLHFYFTNQAVVAMHLMLHGELKLDKESKHKHAIFIFEFAGGLRLQLLDWQKAATVTLNPEPSTVPDAMDKSVTLKYLQTIFQSKRPVKTVLMDQHLIRGIGNAYADEILYYAGIAPASISNCLPPATVKRLKLAITHVLRNAIRHINKAQPGLISGEVRDFMLVHSSKKKRTGNGEKILASSIGGRKTYYTASQQIYRK